ncbi:MAG: transposase zinc-binding domain-containing protein, partial [Clostridia bacterium]|nr:transposase zinc-binding domain-containing protein [Clostridia bacterium]
MNIIQQIFKDHFYDLADTNIKIRKTVFENVERMLHCGDFNYGYTFYGCEHCGTLRAFPFRCKSRFCTSCGNLYSIKRSTNISFKLVHSTHR